MPNSDIPIVGTRKPDSDVGTPGGPAVAGGKQSAAQAAITRQGSGGETDADRNAAWNGTRRRDAAIGSAIAPRRIGMLARSGRNTAVQSPPSITLERRIRRLCEDAAKTVDAL